MSLQLAVLIVYSALFIGFGLFISRRVKKATVNAASSERPKDSSKALSVVHLMNSPPVLHSNAAPSTRKSGEACAAAPLLCDLSAKFASQYISI